MQYLKHYTTKTEHLDVQQIMDGLYYPFYMEDCRHAFIREVLDFNFEEEAASGTYMVLSKYTIEFLRSLKKDDQFSVSCAVFRDEIVPSTLHFRQEIIRSGKLMTRAVFSGTCVPATGGRPFLPQRLFHLLSQVPVL
jgi:acyl-CoA thioester hydrolase